MLCFGASAYFSLLQIGHMMRAREKYGNQAQKMHNDTRLTDTDCCSAWKLVLLHATEQIRQTFLNITEALCGLDQSALDNTCCYLESKQQHINRTMNLKFAVLDNAFIFSFFMALWTLNPYDLIFDSGDWWWLFFYLGIPHIMWAYEAILVQWLKVNSQAEGGAMFQQETHSEKVWKAIRFVPKAIIFCMGFIAALFENYLKKCSGIDDWCLEGDSATVEKKLGTDRCSCADQYLISVGEINLTRTTWPFMVWGVFVGGHVLAYFVLFATSGHNISKQLDQAQSGGETSVQPKTPGKKMQSKESRNIRHFIRILTALFLSVSVVFVVFVVYPDVNMRSHISFWIIWKIILLVTLFFMYRCVRTPDSRASHWLSTIFCCGEETRESIVMTVDPFVDRLTNRISDFKRRMSRTGSSAPMSSAEEINSGIVLEGTPSIDSDDEDEVQRRNGRGGASQDGAVTSPFGHAEDGNIAGEQSVELHEIPVKDGKPATLGRSNVRSG